MLPLTANATTATATTLASGHPPTHTHTHTHHTHPTPIYLPYLHSAATLSAMAGKGGMVIGEISVAVVTARVVVIAVMK